MHSENSRHACHYGNSNAPWMLSPFLQPVLQAVERTRVINGQVRRYLSKAAINQRPQNGASIISATMRKR